MNEFFLFPVADMAGAFWDSTLPGKIIVIILFLGSAAAWTIMWTKSVQLKTASTSTNIFLADFRKNKNLASLMKNIGKHHNTPLVNIFKSGYSTALEIKSESLSDFESNNIGPRIRMLKNTARFLKSLDMLTRIGISTKNMGIDQFTCIFPVKLLMTKKTIIIKVG